MRTLSTVKLTNNQSKVLATIISNKDNPLQAARSISTDANVIGARNLLIKMDAITYTDTHAAVTQLGNKLAIDNNITDESGNLTDFGNSVLSQDSPQDKTNGEQPVDLPVDNTGMEEPLPSMEQFSPLFKSLLHS